MQKVLVVVDMQNDFVSGALGSPEAEKILPYVVRRVADGVSRGEKIFFTRDTHQDNYLETQEGHKLPVPHCIEGSGGWQIVDQLQKYASSCEVMDKITFGSVQLGERMKQLQAEKPIEQITFIGLCTDICVISNAVLVKAYLPEVKILVDARCCAGVTPQSHENALKAMQMCQIEIENFSKNC